MAMNFYIVDAFTDRPFSGNTAGVVVLGPNDALPDERLMVQVAAELRYSESAFVHRHTPTEFTIRYFTPVREVDLCGHATIASFAVLRQLGLTCDGSCCLLHTLAGDLEVQPGDPVLMQMAPARVVPAAIDISQLHTIMVGDGPQPDWPELPIEVVSTGLPDIILPVSDVAALNALRPDMAGLARLSRELQVTGVHAFALDGVRHTAHVRNFGPAFGIDEESATGTANGALTHYLLRHGLIAAPARCSFLQGQAMGRPSVVMTSVGDDGRVWVGGAGCIVAQGQLLV